MDFRRFLQSETAEEEQHVKERWHHFCNHNVKNTRCSNSTSQVGLHVDHDATSKMITKYQALLDKLNASDMPPDAQYRINVEKIARFRIAAAQENVDDPEKVEEICNCGQVEELVIQADNEMIVLDMYLRNRWWELVKPVEIEYNPGDEDGGHGDVEWGESPEDATEKKPK